MQVSVENGEGLVRRMRVALPTDDILQKVDQKLKQIARTTRMDGFRPGKAPLALVKSRYRNHVVSEVVYDSVDRTLNDACREVDLWPVGRPEITPEIDETAGQFAYVAQFEIMPAIELQPFAADAHVKRSTAEVTDADLDAMVMRLRKQQATWQTVERVSQKGDRLTIAFEGTLDGEPFEGGSAEKFVLELGSDTMIEGFESGLEGVAAGEQRTLDLHFPDPYSRASLAGKPVRFVVDVKEVQEPNLPALDEAFFTAYGLENADETKFRAEIRSNMERELRHRIQANVKEQALDLLYQANPISTPKAMVMGEQQNLLEQTKANLNSKFELPIELFESRAQRRVALGLLVAEVLKAQKIQLDEGRVQQELEEVASTYESPDEVRIHYAKKEHRKDLESLVLENQVVDWIVSQVQVQDEPGTFAEVTGTRW